MKPATTSAATKNAGRLKRLHHDAERMLAANDLAGADNAATCALALAPDDAETLRMAGRVQTALGRPAAAIGCYAQSLQARPDDAATLRDLAAAQTANDDSAGAVATLRRIVEREPTAANWFELGLAYDRNADCAEAIDAAEHVLQRDPQHATARFLIARSLTGLGRIDEAAALYRSLTAARSEAAKAWFGLIDLKTIEPTDTDIDAMAQIVADARSSDDERMLAGFALGQACEMRGRFAEALDHIDRANRLRRRQVRWDAAVHARHIDAIRSAFSAPVASAPAGLGEQVVFIVGMPRSGTTLVEQMLAAHPDVIGASELPHLEAVLREESARRGRPFPHWVGAATAADWERLGRNYLSRTERWQTARRFIDKLPENWPYVGAALAMLPGARVIGCERDLVETCWSCYKQLFAPHRVGYSYSMAELAAYAHDSRRLWAWWRERYAQSCRTLSHEALLADPRAEMTTLLEFCGLPFDVACLETQGAARITRTASAAQVRRPLQSSTARRARYGELFAPLQAALEAAGEPVER